MWALSVSFDRSDRGRLDLGLSSAGHLALARLRSSQNDLREMPYSAQNVETAPPVACHQGDGAIARRTRGSMDPLVATSDPRGRSVTSKTRTLSPMSVVRRRIEHMIEQLTAGAGAGTGVDDDLDPAGLLASIRRARSAEDAAAARQLDLAARWADLHPPESIHSAASFTARGCEHEEPIAGAGCPAVAEFCVAELGAVLGVSTTAAKRLIGHALELRHRLPRLWDQVHAGRVPAWRARLVAEATIHATPTLTPEAAGWVDTQVAAVAGRVGPAQLDRLVAEAIKRFELAEEEPFDPDGWQKVDPRHVTIDRDQAHFAGTLHLEAEIDIADALDLDRALAHGAATRHALGSTAVARCPPGDGAW